MTIELPKLPKHKPELRTTKLLCLGNAGIGKTSIIKALCDPRTPFDGTGDDTATTVDFFAVSLPESMGITRRFCFFDTGGHESLNHIRLELMNDVDGVLIFYSDKPSWLSIESRWLLEAKDVMGKVPVIVCAITPSAVPEKQASAWAATKKIILTNASVKDTSSLVKTLCDTYPIR